MNIFPLSFPKPAPEWFSFQLEPQQSPNQRDDGLDSGDNDTEADQMGWDPGHATVDPTSFGGTSSIRHPTSGRFDLEEEMRDTDGMEEMLPTDSRLGLTNVGDVPADDWAADTGDTRTAEEE